MIHDAFEIQVASLTDVARRRMIKDAVQQSDVYVQAKASEFSKFDVHGTENVLAPYPTRSLKREPRAILATSRHPNKKWNMHLYTKASKHGDNIRYKVDIKLGLYVNTRKGILRSEYMSRICDLLQIIASFNGLDILAR